MGINRHTEIQLLEIFDSYPIVPDDQRSPSRAVLLGRPDMIGTVNATPEKLFRVSGASEIDSIDIDEGDGANLIHDLNFPVPENLKGKYSLVFDNGTMEHCFDIRQFIFNVNFLLAKNGLVVHTNPLNNYANHGFFQFSPCFYLGFYMQNNFEILEVRVNGSRKVFYQDRPSEYETVFDCKITGQNLGKLLKSPRIVFSSAKGLDTMVSITFVARKLTDQSDSVVPQQPIYSRFFSGYGSAPIIHI